MARKQEIEAEEARVRTKRSTFELRFYLDFAFWSLWSLDCFFPQVPKLASSVPKWASQPARRYPTWADTRPEGEAAEPRCSGGLGLVLPRREGVMWITS